ncbi:hypothetical protein ACWCQP_47895, partial [Streptomyces chartreusis]
QEHHWPHGWVSDGHQPGHPEAAHLGISVAVDIAPYRQPEASTWDDGATPHGPRYAAMQAFKARTYRVAAARAAAALTETRRLVTRQREPAQERPVQESRIPGAHPENVLLTRQEFASLVESSTPVLAGETLWAQADEATAYRLDAECRRGTWEYNPPTPPEPR